MLMEAARPVITGDKMEDKCAEGSGGGDYLSAADTLGGDEACLRSIGMSGWTVDAHPRLRFRRDPDRPRLFSTALLPHFRVFIN